MTATPTDAAELASALDQSRDPDWQVRCDAAGRLGHFANDAEAQNRLIAMLSDPENISVIEAAASALVLSEEGRGLERFAAVFDSLDEQAGSYAAVAVSDALGDLVFVRLLEVITGTDDPRVRDGARNLGADIGMRTSPEWELAFPDRPVDDRPQTPIDS